MPPNVRERGKWSAREIAQLWGWLAALASRGGSRPSMVMLTDVRPKLSFRAASRYCRRGGSRRKGMRCADIRLQFVAASPPFCPQWSRLPCPVASFFTQSECTIASPPSFCSLCHARPQVQPLATDNAGGRSTTGACDRCSGSSVRVGRFRWACNEGQQRRWLTS